MIFLWYWLVFVLIFRDFGWFFATRIRITASNQAFDNVYTFRLAFSKDPTVSTTAGATVRHLVSAVYDRAISVKEPAAETYKETHK